MDIDLVTKADILQLKNEIISLLSEALSSTSNTGKRYLKSSDVMEMLGISASSLQTLRINGSIPFTKLGGTIYYDYTEITKILQRNKRNCAWQLTFKKKEVELWHNENRMLKSDTRLQVIWIGNFIIYKTILNGKLRSRKLAPASLD